MRTVFALLGEGKITLAYLLHVMRVAAAEEAFRALQSGNIVGKIVLKMGPDDVVPVMPREKTLLVLDTDAMYLLTGGLGGIGKSLADLMVKHSAKNIAFVSRSGVQTTNRRFILLNFDLVVSMRSHMLAISRIGYR
jgi:NADPH:quinone reductase-like Zn-dependent oxidoreductase